MMLPLVSYSWLSFKIKDKMKGSIVKRYVIDISCDLKKHCFLLHLQIVQSFYN
jgi:hypothetical protein